MGTYIMELMNRVGISQGCPDKEWSSKRADPQGRHGNIYL